MSTQPEEFEKLQRLLKLKRHEQPPPGYFNDFSGRVINQIERAQRNESATWEKAAWMRKFFMLLETNPIAAGLFGISICGLLLSSIVFAQYRPAGDFAASTGPGVGVDLASARIVPNSLGWAKASTVDSLAPSTNPLFSTNAPGALFSGLNQLGVQEVNYTVGH